MRGSAALLSPAAAIPKRVHARTRRFPSPPLPRERGRLAATEKTRKETCRQAVCRPSAFCSGAFSGLGTRAGHRCPHMAGTPRWEIPSSPRSCCRTACSAQVHIFCFLRFFGCVLNSFLGHQGNSFLLLGFMHFCFISNLLQKPQEMPKHFESLRRVRLGSVHCHQLLCPSRQGIWLRDLGTLS